MDLREIEATLPPGFRFYPSDEELVCHYLYRKITNENLSKGTMVEVDLHTCEPWQLPDVAKLGANEWYFFSFRERKYATGLRTNRATVSGYWKATGKDRQIFSSITRSLVGMRKTLVFYRDRAPHGIKTGWIMHEFRLEITAVSSKDWVLCRVFHKSNGDSTCRYNFEDEFDNTIGPSSPIFASLSPISQSMQGRLQPFIQVPETPHFQENNNPNTLLNIAQCNPTFLELPCLEVMNNMLNIESRTADEYEFLNDMNLED
ncbi:hypothetical protein IFM89_003566 [Coptis chinensis]|uniref:NAC domain-containing protein n=1 Tax=Coptis chinensis TaxID=261450 RepID=A0A835I0N2_9MAGN|nr:hypothetical protein IFM89_003566 [Coptis chinensis]